MKFLGSIGRDFEFYYDPKDFYKELTKYGGHIKLPLTHPWRLQTNIVFDLGKIEKSDIKSPPKKIVTQIPIFWPFEAKNINPHPQC